MEINQPVIASVSGGRDSTALCLWLKKNNVRYRAVHMDTGWEHPKTDRYIREILPQHIGPVEWLQPERTMVDLILHKGMFPSRTIRYCTQFLKIFVLQEWIEQNYGEQQIINAVGVRAAESKARSKLDEWEDIEWAMTWRPLLRWSHDDVRLIHEEFDCPPNPLYLDEGMSRVGCWPCIFARKAEIRCVADTDPQRIDLIRQLESRVTDLGRQRYADRGETFESLGYAFPSFFSLKKKIAKYRCYACERPSRKVGGRQMRMFIECEDMETCPNCGANMTKIWTWKNVCAPIDEVVAWSRTPTRFRQKERFYEKDRSSCMRWGLCDI